MRAKRMAILGEIAAANKNSDRNGKKNVASSTTQINKKIQNHFVRNIVTAMIQAPSSEKLFSFSFLCTPVFTFCYIFTANNSKKRTKKFGEAMLRKNRGWT